jgi:hypothetical protein
MERALNMEECRKGGRDNESRTLTFSLFDIGSPAVRAGSLESTMAVKTKQSFGIIPHLFVCFCLCEFASAHGKGEEDPKAA